MPKGDDNAISRSTLITHYFSARSEQSPGAARLRRQAGPPLIDLFSVVNSTKARGHVVVDMDSVSP
jgi:hypothetical protein